MADKIANLLTNDNKLLDTQTLEKNQIWIRHFLFEFMKKWTKIDFLRMDKYIMLVQTIIRKYFEINLNDKNFNEILSIFDSISQCLNAGFYNFSFILQILNLFSWLIDEIFKETLIIINDKNFSNFIDKILDLFVKLADKRLMETFRDGIFNKLTNYFSQDVESDSHKMNTMSTYREIYYQKVFSLAKSKYV